MRDKLVVYLQHKSERLGFVYLSLLLSSAIVMTICMLGYALIQFGFASLLLDYSIGVKMVEDLPYIILTLLFGVICYLFITSIICFYLYYYFTFSITTLYKPLGSIINATIFIINFYYKESIKKYHNLDSENKKEPRNTNIILPYHIPFLPNSKRIKNSALLCYCLFICIL